MISRYSVYFLLFLFFISCSETSEVETFLNAADEYIENNPEMALKTLETIDRGLLNTNKVQAKYALLYSIALDKNYIDVKSDSIIAPAVKYYKHHGTAEDKFRTLYYLGRIYQNAGDVETAMKMFVQAEHHIPYGIDKRLIARLYKAKMVAYRDVFDYQSAVEQAKEAADFFLLAKDTIKYLNAINDIAILYDQLGEKDSEKQYMDILGSNIHLLNQHQLSIYYLIQLSVALESHEKPIQEALHDYLNVATDGNVVNWLYVTDAYVELQDYQSALSSLENYVRYGGDLDLTYFWTAATLYEKFGEYNKALPLYKKYMHFADSVSVAVFKSDTKFIEERYNSEQKSLKQRFYIVIISLVLLIIILVSVILYQKIKRIKAENHIQKVMFEEERQSFVDQKEQVEARYNLVNEEKKEIEKMFESLKDEIKQLKKIEEECHIDKDILDSIEQRLNVLNMFILSELSDSFEKIAFIELGKLMENRAEFLDSTKKTFMVSNPRFIKYLQKQKLTDLEIGYCCLYCIGFNGIEISKYLDRKAIYNINGIIRKKLDIPKGGTQIDVFLKQKMREFHQ